MAKLGPKDYAIALNTLTKEYKDENLVSAINHFVQILFRKGNVGSIDLILKEFELLKKRESVENLVEIELANNEYSGLVDNLKKVLGEEIEVHTVINPSIIGGIRIKIGNKVFDGSVRNSIDQLKTKLK